MIKSAFSRHALELSGWSESVFPAPCPLATTRPHTLCYCHQGARRVPRAMYGAGHHALLTVFPLLVCLPFMLKSCLFSFLTEKVSHVPDEACKQHTKLYNQSVFSSRTAVPSVRHPYFWDHAVLLLLHSFHSVSSRGFHNCMLRVASLQLCLKRRGFPLRGSTVLCGNSPLLMASRCPHSWAPVGHAVCCRPLCRRVSLQLCSSGLYSCLPSLDSCLHSQNSP